MIEAKNGQDLCSSDAERLTPLGRMLRRLSLDELPELLNVLRGDMSLVGPRLLLMQYLERYTPEQAGRHEAKRIAANMEINGKAQFDSAITSLWEWERS
jgi:lipopolysaccharide/colanic/teichoic acid biosynthesis glycosyltransferase